MINISDKHNCCGCEACINVCPKGCITAKFDSEGFLYPCVDESQCIKCGKCVRVCPFSGENEKKTPIISYEGYTDNDKIRMSSSSGGAFAILAQAVFEKGGRVYGAAFDDNMKLVHMGIDDNSLLEKLQGSKYLQSRINDIYSQVENDLKNGRETLFVGTPCQVRGLKNYLAKDYPTLLCVDFVCHGVPSQLLFDKYLEQRNDKKVVSFSFRDKSVAWEKYGLRAYYADGSDEYIDKHKDAYMKAFLKNVSLRPSCYSCKVKGFSSGSDITLGDCWRKVKDADNDHKGISVIYVNTEHGKSLLDEAAGKLKLKETTPEKEIAACKCTIAPVARNKNRNIYMSKINTESVSSLAKKYASDTYIHKIKQKLKSLLKK